MEAAAARKLAAEKAAEVTVERVLHLQAEAELEGRNREDRQMLGIAHKEAPRLTAEWQRSRDQRDAALSLVSGLQVERNAALAALDTSRGCCQQLREDKAAQAAQIGDLQRTVQDLEGKMEHVSNLKRKILSLEALPLPTLCY